MPSMQSVDSLPSVSSVMQRLLRSHSGQIVVVISVIFICSMLFAFRTSWANFRYLPSAILGTSYLAAFKPP